MRGKVWEVCRAGAPLLLILVVCTLAAGCESTCGDWDACAPTCAAPCAPRCESPCAPACQPQPSGQCGPFPPNAAPGEAWCCVFVPPQYAQETERVCTQPECSRKEWVPPVYECRSKQVCTNPGCTRQIPIPAEYATQKECVEVCPARTEWRRVDCTPEQLACGEQQGECWALVTIPPQYEERCKQVCVREASCREEVTPPSYETVQEQVEVSCGYYKDIPIPAVYEDRCKQVCTAPGRWEWRRNTNCVVPQPQVCNPCVPNSGMYAQPAPGAYAPAPGGYAPAPGAYPAPAPAPDMNMPPPPAPEPVPEPQPNPDAPR